ncbi:MAG: hypothetical protein FWG68_07400 [Defluviitaleaceae bacterium]|nr:hypothetical protein [Defluviitaleaceae bacterium]
MCAYHLACLPIAGNETNGRTGERANGRNGWRPARSAGGQTGGKPIANLTNIS